MTSTLKHLARQDRFGNSRDTTLKVADLRAAGGSWRAVRKLSGIGWYYAGEVAGRRLRVERYGYGVSTPDGPVEDTCHVLDHLIDDETGETLETVDVREAIVRLLEGRFNNDTEMSNGQRNEGHLG